MLVLGTRSFWCAAAMSFLTLASGPSVAQQNDLSRDRDLANDYCSGCHEMTDAKGREHNGRYVPSFPEVANTPHYSLVRLRRIIAVPPHAEMPKMPLEHDEIDAIARFIQSLRKKTN
jgi:mono/diheme cytochrome c family protein